MGRAGRVSIAVDLQAGIKNPVIHIARAGPGYFVVREPGPAASRLPHCGANAEQRIQIEVPATHAGLPQVAAEDVGKGRHDGGAVGAVHVVARARSASDPIQKGGAIE